MIKQRYIENDIQELCFNDNKMAFISGPRQCGKTTLAKFLLKKRNHGAYFNWDELSFRKLWTKNPSEIVNSFPEKVKPLIVLDEIHKAHLWKRNLKGVYDTLKQPCDLLITGSARLNTYRKGGDSLMGRYYLFRLHPFSLAELCNAPSRQNPHQLVNTLSFDKNKFPTTKETADQFKELMSFGPFPEPLLAGSIQKLNLWRRSRIEKIVREDLRDLSHLPELSRIEQLIALLPEKCGNLLSTQSLSEDLEAGFNTVKHWLNYLQELYYCFTIMPYTNSMKRGIKKAQKIYLWDWSEIEDPGAKFENLVASHLLKYCNYMTDTGFGNYGLFYIRNKQKQEIDFLITRNGKPWLPIEVKTHDKLSANWKIFLPQINCKLAIQITKKPNVYKFFDVAGYEILLISIDQFLLYLI